MSLMSAFKSSLLLPLTRNWNYIIWTYWTHTEPVLSIEDVTKLTCPVEHVFTSSEVSIQRSTQQLSPQRFGSCPPDPGLSGFSWAGRYFNCSACESLVSAPSFISLIFSLLSSTSWWRWLSVQFSSQLSLSCITFGYFLCCSLSLDMCFNADPPLARVFAVSPFLLTECKSLVCKISVQSFLSPTVFSLLLILTNLQRTNPSNLEMLHPNTVHHITKPADIHLPSTIWK